MADSEKVEELAVAQKRLRRATFSAIFLLIGLQAGWMLVISQSATREVNNLDSPFHSSHFFEVPDITATGKSMQVSFTCSNVIGQGNSSDDIWWALYDESGRVVVDWNGMSGGDCGGFDLSLPPGDYKILTSEDSGADFEQNLHLKVWKSLSFEGHVIGFIIAILLGGDGIWRARKKIKALNEPTDQHKISQKGVWEQVHSEMEEGDRIQAEVTEMSFTGFSDQPEDESQDGKKIPALSEYDQTAEIELEEEERGALDEMAKGTMQGLSGPVERDERIKRVGDIYDLMDD